MAKKNKEIFSLRRKKGKSRYELANNVTGQTFPIVYSQPTEYDKQPNYVCKSPYGGDAEDLFVDKGLLNKLGAIYLMVMGTEEEPKDERLTLGIHTSKEWSNETLATTYATEYVHTEYVLTFHEYFKEGGKIHAPLVTCRFLFRNFGLHDVALGANRHRKKVRTRLLQRLFSNGIRLIEPSLSKRTESKAARNSVKA